MHKVTTTILYVQLLLKLSIVLHSVYYRDRQLVLLEKNLLETDVIRIVNTRRMDSR